MDQQLIPQTEKIDIQDIQNQESNLHLDKQVKSLKVFIALVLMLLLVVLGGMGYLYYQFSAEKQTKVVAPTKITSSTPKPTSQAETKSTVPSDWMTHKNTSLRFEIGYPPDVKPEKEVNDKYNRFTDFKGDVIHFEVMLRQNPGNITLSNYNYMDSIVSEKTTLGGIDANIYRSATGYCDGPGCSEPYIAIVTINGSDIYHLSFYGDDQLSQIESQILSTFRFTEETAQNTPNPPTESVTYKVPSTWQKTTLSSGLNLCLPPKWETDQWGNLYFNRDAGYRPTITTIQSIPYDQGSRREAYFTFWKTEYPDAPERINVMENNINGNSVLTMYPKYAPEAKGTPEGLTVVWYAQGKLWKASLSSWSYVNDSQTAFLSDFYKAISCSF